MLALVGKFPGQVLECSAALCVTLCEAQCFQKLVCRNIEPALPAEQAQKNRLPG